MSRKGGCLPYIRCLALDGADDLTLLILHLRYQTEH